MLELENIHTGYGPIKVLNGVDLEVGDSEITGIIGPNGAGKSTCFKAIFGLIDTWEGDIRFHGESITEMRSDLILKKGICYVMQGRHIFPKLTVRENLEMGGYSLESSEEIEENIESVYETFPALREKSSAQARLLSGGQQKMLELGMALMVDPDLLLLDEPSLGLAPAIRSDMFDIITDLTEKEDLSILAIEQNIRELLEIADRAYVLEQGSVRMSGGGQELLHNEEVIDLYLGAVAQG
ncbi:ABC transporter ATP-binding protein [Salinirussus salinus]|uniref:ABC transporter ATP-binding protein n=1 Tax=Salinirussus salinus TaxID=1198300 RepID=UPI001357DD61|nr:ABC transporter ATP-binding protein [Salinirussus salinus]